MRIRRSFVAALAAAILIAGVQAGAQDRAVEEPAPVQGPKVPAGQALKQIPADCLGFVIVNNAAGMGAKLDAFQKSVMPPGAPAPPTGVLGSLLAQAEIGAGFNANAPFAAVILDPQLYGINVLEALNLPGVGSAESEDETAKPPLPVVVLIPGKDPATMLAAHSPVKEGDFFKTDDGGYWVQKGEFVIGGNNKKAVEAVLATEKSVVSQLSLADKALIARSDAAAWVNFKIIGPTIDAALAAFKAKLKADADKAPVSVQMGPDMAGMAMAMDMYAVLLKEIDDVALGVRFGETGIMFETRASFKAAGVVGKALAAAKPVSGSLLDRLPNMPYVLAMGFRGDPSAAKEMNIQMLEKLLTSTLFRGFKEETRARMTALAGDLQAEVEGVQLFAGAVTSGEGQVGLAYVLECKSAEKVRGLLPEYIAVLSEMYQSMPDETLNVIALKYHKGVEVIAETEKKVDVISIDHPALADLDEEDLAKMKAVLGDDKIRLLVAQADAKTLVLTLGGGKSFLAEVLKTAAARSGKLAADPATAKSLAMLPKQRSAVGLLHIGNIFTIVKTVSAALGEQMPPIQVDAPQPLVGSISIEKSDVLMVGYIPTETIKNAIGGVMAMMMGAMGPPPPPPGGGAGPGLVPVPGPGF